MSVHAEPGTNRPATTYTLPENANKANRWVTTHALISLRHPFSGRQRPIDASPGKCPACRRPIHGRPRCFHLRRCAGGLHLETPPGRLHMHERCLCFSDVKNTYNLQLSTRFHKCLFRTKHVCTLRPSPPTSFLRHKTHTRSKLQRNNYEKLIRHLCTTGDWIDLQKGPHYIT